MTATTETLRGWLDSAADGGARWVVIKSDPSDVAFHGDRCYPVPLTRAVEVHRCIEAGDDTLEVYDLDLSIEEQLKEERAWHPPLVPATDDDLINQIYAECHTAIQMDFPPTIMRSLVERIVKITDLHLRGLEWRNLDER